jgi:hypothetical protein
MPPPRRRVANPAPDAIGKRKQAVTRYPTKHFKLCTSVRVWPSVCLSTCQRRDRRVSNVGRCASQVQDAILGRDHWSRASGSLRHDAG